MPRSTIQRRTQGEDQMVLLRRIIDGRSYTRELSKRGVLTVAETAIFLGLTPMQIYRLIVEGQLKSVKRRGGQTISLTSLRRYIAWKQKEK